jgi:hypothetical protein
VPLPTGGPWPPKPIAPALERIATWSAWYSGDPDELSAIYQRIGQRMTNRPNVRPSQMRGGLVGTLARWFWGQPIPVGEKRSKLHVPIAGDIAATSADLLFSEAVTLSVPADSTETTSTNNATQDRLDQLIDDAMHAQLLEAAEVAAALGGVYLRAVWDTDVNPDGPWLSPVHADAAIPEWSYGRLTAVTFWRVIAMDGSKVVRHLERHALGVIEHGVFEGSDTELGRAVPLTEYADTAGLAEVVADGNQVPTGIDQLTACYIPNMRPNRLWRNEPAAVHLGRSDYAGAEPMMDALDEVFTSWMRDVRLAKARIIVPEAYLQSRGPGRGAYFDPDREVYEVLNMLPSSDGSAQLKAEQFEIRVDEHSKTALDLVTRIVAAAGYSGQTFGLTGDVAVTEVAARERKSLITRDKKLRYVRPELACMVEALLKLGNVHFGWGITPVRPLVEFPDAVQQDPTALAQTLSLLEQAKAVSTKTKVVMLHPEWDDAEVAEEVDRINGEQGSIVTNPDTFTGGLGPDGGQLPDTGAPLMPPEPPVVQQGTNTTNP